ncbi:MAG TPA: hypothetical protein VLX28_13255 [Thermoanaerobaculia bacterium]|nr:hypothetical protein [Thermoanaerobaculia bacterium]
MRKKMMLLALSLAAVAASLTAPRAKAGGTHACPICTTYADCSQCCVSCICDDAGNLIACTNHICPPPDGPCEKG